MAKALTIILLLAATAAIATAHPGLKGGKGGSITVTKTQGSAGGSGGGDKNSGGCKCTENCENVEKKACREVEVEREVCKDEDKVIDEVICVQKCIKADKVISIGKGRRLSGANIIGKGAGGITLNQAGKDAGTAAPAPAAEKQQQEVCRDVCNPERRTVKENVCKKVMNMERVDCRVVSVTPVCAKSCECGFIGGKGKGR